MTLTFEYTLDAGAGLFPQVIHTSDNLLRFIYLTSDGTVAGSTADPVLGLYDNLTYTETGRISPDESVSCPSIKKVAHYGAYGFWSAEGDHRFVMYARTVLESTIEQVLVTAINQTLCDKDSFLTTLRNNIATVINRESDKALADIDKRLEALQTELLKLATSNADYDKVGDEIHRLRDQKQKLLLENANRDELKKRIADMSTFLKKQSAALTKYDEQLVRRLIEKVTIYEDKFTVVFKSGVTVDVEE